MVCSPGKPGFADINERNWTHIIKYSRNVENGVVLSYLRSDEHVI